MMDFHVHVRLDGTGEGARNALSNDNGMLPAEALRYASLCGCRAVGLVLRSDGWNLSGVAALAQHVRRIGLYTNVEAFAGVELVHVPPALLPEVVQEARTAGADFVMVHGETLAEQHLDLVDAGTNFAAVEAGADILAHPGIVDAEVAAFAAEKGVALEWTACPRHALSNSHVVAMAERFNTILLPGSDARNMAELVAPARWKQLFQGGMLSDTLQKNMRNNSALFVKKIMSNKLCNKNGGKCN